MSDQTQAILPTSPTTTSSSGRRRRPSPSPSGPDAQPQNPVGRTKRRKYTAVACDECRRRKLKCIPGGPAGGCERCTSKGYAACNYRALCRANADTANRGNMDEHDTVSALKRDVEMLRGMLGEWMSAAKKQSDPFGGESRQHLPADMLPPTPVTLPDRRPSAGAENFNTGSSMPPTRVRITTQTSSSRPSRNVPEEPRFVGPTRPAYSLEAGDEALSRLGIPSCDNAPNSGQQTPAASPRQQSATLDSDFWETCDCTEFARLMTVFQEEVESVYPSLGTERLVRHAADILQMGQMSEEAAKHAARNRSGPIDIKDLHLATLAIATTIVIEGHGKSESTTMLIAPVERSVLNILKPSRELRDLQLLVLLSIYYFHSDQDLLAWRCIGLAAREALVMGLHRRATLLKTFPDPEEREVAVRVFWTIYVLDRRWSFGTSLSFALVDRDIDAELPEPGQNCAYLQCMVGYGRLCSVLWEALVPFSNGTGSGKGEDVVKALYDLDISTQEWLESIPLDLRLRHPRLGLAARAQPPVLQRLRALLYLRGNHSRILIYRYYLLGPSRIRSSIRNAWLAVEIAQDSIEVLVHLNDSSEIYRRQQAAFNYFLLSALAVIFLAVCNAPETFAAPCKKSLHSAIDLLRYFSRHSWGSRRLWRSVKGILPRLRRLEVQREEERRRNESSSAGAGGGSSSSASLTTNDGVGGARSNVAPSSGAPATAHTVTTPAAPTMPGNGPALFCHHLAPPLEITTPDFGDVGNELRDLFETFEQCQAFVPQPNIDEPIVWGGELFEAPNFMSQDQQEISWQFDWLIH